MLFARSNASSGVRKFRTDSAIPVAMVFALASPLIGGKIVFDAKPTSTYIVLHSINLCNWQEVLRVKSQQSGPMAVPIRFDDTQGFWRIESFTEP